MNVDIWRKLKFKLKKKGDLKNYDSCIFIGVKCCFV